MFDAFDAIGAALLRAIARALALPVDYFADKCQRRQQHPAGDPLSADAAQPHRESVRAGAHEDINVITLLMGAEEPGLQVLSKQGEWLSVNPPPGSLVVNVGDMLQRLSNNVLRSTTHRVVNPVRERASNARFSMPVFPALQSGFPDQHAARLHRAGPPEPLPRRHHGRRLPAAAPPRDKTKMNSTLILQAIAGIVTFTALALPFSSNWRRISWKLVATAIALQFAICALLLKALADQGRPRLHEPCGRRARRRHAEGHGVRLWLRRRTAQRRSP